MRGLRTFEFLKEARRLQERNNFLATRLGQMTKSRDLWKRKAIERRREIENLRRQLGRRKTKACVPELRFSSADLERIRSIPDRPIY